MAARGAANGQYTVIISVDAKDAEATLAALSTTVDDVGGSMQTVAPRLVNVGTGLESTARGSAAAAAELDRAEGKARSILRTLETGALNGSFSSINSALAGVATSGGTASLALGAVGAASVAGLAAAIGAANAYADQAIAMEQAATAAGVLTPEIAANAERARDWQDSTQRLGDQFSQLASTLGGEVIDALSETVDGVSALTENINNFIEANSGVADALSWLLQGGVVSILRLYGQTQSDVNDTDQERIRTLNELTASLQERTQAEADAADTVRQYASDSLAAEQADLRVAQLRAKNEQDAARESEQRAARVAAARKQEQNARERLADVEEQAAQRSAAAAKAEKDAEQNLADTKVESSDRIVSAKKRVEEAQRRLNEANRVDRDQARNLADAQLRLRRVQEDIASGKLSGVDATRAYQDAETDLTRTQEDNIDAERKRQDAIAEAQDSLADAKKAQRDAEVQAARDIREAEQELAAARKAHRQADIKGARDVKRAQEDVADAADKVTEANKRAGKSALDRKADELALNAALLAQARAHERVKQDIDDIKTALANGNITWAEFQAILNDLHVNVFPAIKQDLADISAALYAMPGSSYAVGGSTYQSQVPKEASSRSGFVGPSGGSNGFEVTVNVNAAGVVADKRSADAIGSAVATGVVAELRRQNASGVRFGIR